MPNCLNFLRTNLNGLYISRTIQISGDIWGINGKIILWGCQGVNMSNPKIFLNPKIEKL